MKRKRKIYVSACLSLCLSDEEEMSCRGERNNKKRKKENLPQGANQTTSGIWMIEKNI
jgi:hypothetical protein